MKIPKIPVMKMPMPTTHAVQAGQKAAARAQSFAYHPPVEISRMSRPKGGKGPHNPTE